MTGVGEMGSMPGVKAKEAMPGTMEQGPLTQVTADGWMKQEVVAKAQRGRFTAAYKRRILQAVDRGLVRWARCCG